MNGQYVGDHRGGYARFSFDITRFVKAKKMKIVVKVEEFVGFPLAATWKTSAWE